MRCTILALVALIACKDRKPEPPPPPPPSSDGVTLIQPGTAPYRALRYHLTRGAKMMSELTYDLDVKNDGQGGPVPTLIIEIETTVDEVLADGTAKLRIAFGGTRVRDRPGSEVTSNLLQETASAIQGVVITQTIAPDGKVSDAQIQAAAALPDKPRAQLETLRQGLERMAMRLPAEPIGIGAMWRERTSLPEGGIRAVAETTYTLTSITGDTVGYTSTGLSTGAPQTLEQDNLKVEVTSARGHAEASGTVDLSSGALDVMSSSTFSTAMNVIAPKDTPGAGPSTIDVTMAIAVTPKGGTPAGPAPSTPDAGPDHGAHKAP